MRRLWTRGWVLVHASAVLLVVAFLGLGWWQIQRAAEGNALSFGYAVEWPVFAGFVIFVWVREMRATLRRAAETGSADPEPPAAPVTGWSGQPVRTGPAYDDTGDTELAAYNRYLAWLNAHPQASPADYPG